MRIGVVGRAGRDMFGADIIGAVRDAGHVAVPLGPAWAGHRLMVTSSLAELSLPVYYLPEAGNPRCHRPAVLAGTGSYLVITGNMYPSRVRLLERVMAKGIPVRAHGGAIPRWIGDSRVRGIHPRHPIWAQEKARVFRSAAGILNNLHPAEVAGVNSRFCGAAGSGAAVLSDFRPAVPGLSAVGEEVLVFQDFDGFGDAAARRARRDHIIAQRVATILEKTA